MKTIDPRNAEFPHRTFGQLLMNARLRSELTQAELARRSGVKQSLLSNVEAGRRRASDRLLEAIAPHLSVQLDRLTVLRDFVAVGGSWATGLGAVGFVRGEHDRDPTSTSSDVTSDALTAIDPALGFGAFLVSSSQYLRRRENEKRLEGPRVAEPWLDLFLAASQIVGSGLQKPQGPSSQASKRLDLLRALVVAVRDMDEEDLRRTLDFIAGMQAARTSPSSDK